MTNSRSFDRAANYYDQTRQLLEPIATKGIPALVDAIGSGSRLLEVGAGTGRISIPLLERGVNWVGCDLSLPMMKRFQEKYSSPRIAQADATLLPFPTEHFDIVLTVHVMHLISAWRETLHEIRRVLVPGGAYINVSTWASVGDSVGDKIREFWRGWLRERGVDAENPGARDFKDVQEELSGLGATIGEIEAVRFPEAYTLREELERFASRNYSYTWDIPDAIFEESIKALHNWASAKYGDLDQEMHDEVRFVIHVARFKR
jgi:ubiquinone/menaquinone biosynthesis C-methylase UbiE